MAVRKAGNRWLVEFMQAGHRVFKRLPPEASRQDALDYESQLRREIFDQATLGKRPTISLELAIRTWLEEVNNGRKSAKGTENHAQHVLALVKGEDIKGIQAVAERIEKQHLAPSTRNNRLNVLKAVAKWAWKRKKWTEDNLSTHIALLPTKNQREVYLTQEQVDSLLKATPERSRAFVGLAVYTGIRQGQIVALRPSSIAGDAILLPDSKGGMALKIPVIPQAKKYLAGIPMPLHKRTHYRDFEKARKAIGIGHFTYHDLRHTTASLMIQAGVPLYTVGEILGHKSVQTTKRYAHLSMGNKIEAFSKAFPSGLQQKKPKSRKTKRMSGD